MHIGWDLHDVTADLNGELIYIYNKYNPPVTREDVSDWGFFPRKIHEELKQSGGYARLKLIPGSKELLEKLKSKDRISIITYTHPDYEEQIKEWLEKNIPGLYGKAYLTGGSKLPTCKNLGIQLLVDDSKTQVQAVTQEMGIHAVLIRTNMNKEIKESGLIHIAEDIYKAGDLIEKLRQEIER